MDTEVRMPCEYRRNTGRTPCDHRGEVVVMCLQAKECQGLFIGNHQKLERDKERSSPRAFREKMALLIL